MFPSSRAAIQAERLASHALASTSKATLAATLTHTLLSSFPEWCSASFGRAPSSTPAVSCVAGAASGSCRTLPSLHGIGCAAARGGHSQAASTRIAVKAPVSEPTPSGVRALPADFDTLATGPPARKVNGYGHSLISPVSHAPEVPSLDVLNSLQPDEQSASDSDSEDPFEADDILPSSDLSAEDETPATPTGRIFVIEGKQKFVQALRSAIQYRSTKGCLEVLRNEPDPEARRRGYSFVLARLQHMAALDIWEVMRKDVGADNIIPIEVTVLLQSLEREKNPIEAHAIVNDLMEHHGLPPSGFVLSSLCNVYSAVGAPDKVRDVMRQAQSLGVAITGHFITALVKSFGTSKIHSQLPLQGVLRETQAAGVEVNEHVFRCLVIAYGQRGLAQRSQEVFEAMLTSGIQPSVVSYGALVNAYAESRRPEEAARVVTEMKATGMPVSVETYCALLKAWLRVLNIPEMQAVVDEMNQQNMTLPLAVFLALVEGYRRTRQPARAREVFDTMKAMGRHPDKRIFTALLSAYGVVGDLEGAQAVLKEMQDSGLRPGLRTYTALLSVYGQCGRMDLLEQTYTTMLELGRGLDYVSLMMVAEGYMGAWDAKRDRPELLDKAWDIYQQAKAAVPQNVSNDLARPYRKLVIDLHRHGFWTAQLALVAGLQGILDIFLAQEELPMSDLQVITGRGNRSFVRNQPIMRVVALRFLQELFPVRLAVANDGCLIVHRQALMRVLHFMQARNLRFDLHSLQSCFVGRLL